MDHRCKNCQHRGQETISDVGSCNCCDNGEFFAAEVTLGYNDFSISEPFILEPEDWTEEGWKILCNLCGLPVSVTERIVIHANRIECYIGERRRDI